VLILWFIDWLTGDVVDVGWWRPLLLVFLGFLFSAPYGWAWVKGKAPPPPKPVALVPQAAVQQDDGGGTYVFVGPTAAPARWGPTRKVADFGPISWFLYTVLWRFPLLVGDAVLTVFWRGMTRLFGFNGGPSIQSFDPSTMEQVDYPDDLPPPGSRTF
jgi:hypothetical protein